MLTFFISSIINILGGKKLKKMINIRKLDNENEKNRTRKVTLKLLRRLFHHCPPPGLAASDFMDASLRCTAEGQLQVHCGDPSAMLPAFHSPAPPPHEIRGGPAWCEHRTHGCQGPRTFRKAPPWIRAGRHSSVWKSWRQHPHWDLTSAAGLQDASPRTLGH